VLRTGRAAARPRRDADQGGPAVGELAHGESETRSRSRCDWALRRRILMLDEPTPAWADQETTRSPAYAPATRTQAFTIRQSDDTFAGRLHLSRTHHGARSGAAFAEGGPQRPSPPSAVVQGLSGRGGMTALEAAAAAITARALPRPGPPVGLESGMRDRDPARPPQRERQDETLLRRHHGLTSRAMGRCASRHEVARAPTFRIAASARGYGRTVRRIFSNPLGRGEL